MPVLKMTENKTLSITKSGNTYQDENNAETMKIILPRKINNIDLKDCMVWLSFINQENKGETTDLTDFLTEYSDSNYVAEMPMYQIFTYVAGTIQMWLKIIYSEKQMVAKTNIVSYTIKPHLEIEGTIPEPELSILDSLAMKLDVTASKVDEISGKVEEIDDYVSELQEGEVLLVQPSKNSSGE